MPVTMRDAESAYLDGQAKAQEWLDQFEKDWYSPIREQAVVMLMHRIEMQPGAAGALAQQVPEAWKQMREEYERIKGRYQDGNNLG